MGWAQEEFETIALGDRRLNQRAVVLTERLGQKPGASIPGACESGAETAAAYRFLHNAQVDWEEVLTAHARASTRWCCASRTRRSWTTTAERYKAWDR